MAERKWQMNRVTGFIVLTILASAIVLVESVRYFDEKEKSLAVEPMKVSVKIAKEAPL